MRIFFSAGEPSGDIHASNLIRALARLRPGIDCVGFGGDRMQAAGCRLDYPLCRHAVMGVSRVVAQAATFVRLIRQAGRCFRDHRPDAVVLIDYPGFNWWIARKAHALGIPVFYFVPPQLWAWAGWRVKKMRRHVDHVLCTLPFELPWYRERGVLAHYIGHPFFDELSRQRLDPEFAAGATGRAAHGPARLAGPTVALLPGSRDQEVERNWSMLYRSAARIHQARPDARFLVACFQPHQQRRIEDYLAGHAPLPLATHVGKTPEIINAATACISVSGSVSLELLWRAKPSVIVYRMGAVGLKAARWLVKVPYMCLVNLLAEKELYPEFATHRCASAAVAERVLRWLNDPAVYAGLCQELTSLRDRVAGPGACDRAAGFILDALAQPRAVGAA
ncbi:MAG: lipid-A-disaccharide synthase [Gemmataceae bacterium]|nr:lipid-A-disaccharide synthase [Gemmataceae bacterium]